MLIEKFNPEVVINTGSAGALDQTLSIGDILVSNHVLYHDANATAFGYEYGQIPQMPKTYTTDPTLLKKTMHVLEQQQLNGKVGMIVSGDSFIGSSEQRQKLSNNFQKLWLSKWRQLQLRKHVINLKVPFIVTRAVSDLANGKADISFEEFLDKSSFII